jgi:MFS family permease
VTGEVRRGDGVRLALRSLRSRDFRLIAVGNMISQLGTWVQYVATGWVATELTKSPLLISFVFAVQWLPMLLLSPFAGVLADRSDRRTIIVWGNIAMVIPALGLALFKYYEHLTMAWLIGLVVLGGVAQTFTQPAANSFIPALVPPEDLSGAVALNSGLSNSTRVIGPAIGGLIIRYGGVEWGFAANAVSFFAVCVACLLVHVRVPLKEPDVIGPIAGLRLGARYVFAHKALLRILTMAATVTFLIMHAGLMPVIAKEVLNGDADTYGIISSGPGLGFVIATIATLLLTSEERRTKSLFIAAFGTGLALLIIGLSRALPMTVLGMAIFGATHMTFATVSSTLLLEGCEDEFRGRVMGLFGMVATGLFAVNSFLGGVLATFFGAPQTIAMCGTAILVCAGVFALSGTHDVIRNGLRPPNEAVLPSVLLPGEL